MTGLAGAQAATANRVPLQRQLRLLAWLAVAAFLISVLPLAQVRVPHSAYLTLHTTLEFSSAAVAFLVFVTLWHAPSKEVPLAQLLISLALFAGGWLDVMHALSFKGMPDFISPSSYIKGIDFWLAARFLIAVTMLSASGRWDVPMQSPRTRYLALAMTAAIIAAIIVAILFFEASLPATYIEGQGVTPIKTVLEILITVLLSLAAWRYYAIARTAGSDESALFFGAVAITALAEQFFASYSDVRDLKNLTGHLYKILGYALLYRAIFIASVRRPYELLTIQAIKLRDADDLLRMQSLALQSTSNSVFLTDRRGNVQWRNDASTRQWQARPSEPLPASLFAAPLTPDPLVAEDMRNTVMAGASWSGLVQHRDGAGHRVLYQRVVSPLIGADGVIEGFVSVSEDVTARIQAVEWNKNVLETAINGFIAVDTNHRITAANPALAAMTGYAVHELLHLHIDVLRGEPDQHLREARLDEVMRRGAVRFETWCRHKSGALFDVEISASFDREIEKFFFFVSDLTEVRAGQAHQRDLERQLQQSQKMEAFGQLTGGIAHDFNNILVSILGYSKLALNKFGTDKQGQLAHYLQEVVASSERARDLIARMMVFTRKSPSKHAELINPAAVMGEVIAMVRPSLPSGILINACFEGAECILMDAGELHQVLVNLIVNARDALGEAGHIALTVRPYLADGQICAITQQRLFGPFAALEVRDSGSGIAPEHLQRVFDPFFTTKEVGKGTGLGLSMVQGIVQRAKGHIVVESAPGLGSLFSLLFPIAAATPAAAAPAITRGALPRGDGQHIWVVDDEPSVVAYLEELLTEYGYRVTAFSDPAELLRAFRGHAGAGCDLLIADRTMPGWNGYALAAELVAQKPGLPVILCTGDDSREPVSVVLKQHVFRTFIKPAPAELLLPAVDEVLRLGPSVANC